MQLIVLTDYCTMKIFVVFWLLCRQEHSGLFVGILFKKSLLFQIIIQLCELNIFVIYVESHFVTCPYSLEFVCDVVYHILSRLNLKANVHLNVMVLKFSLVLSVELL